MPDGLPPIDYQPDASLRSIRRSVRWIVWLMLLNTVLLGATVAGPGLSTFVRQEWADYQAAAARRIAATQAAAAATQAAAFAKVERAAVLTAQQQAMTHASPADTLVFAEDFAIGTLPQRGATSATMPTTRQLAGKATSPAAEAQPSFWPEVRIASTNLASPAEAFLFLHARRARPELSERLALLTVDLELNSQGQRYLHAWTLNPSSNGEPLQALRGNGFVIDLPNTVVPRGGTVPPLRFFAGQPDVNDASRWTIRYEFGLGSGTIVARLLADDRIDLTVGGPLAPIVR